MKFKMAQYNLSPKDDYEALYSFVPSKAPMVGSPTKVWLEARFTQLGELLAGCREADEGSVVVYTQEWLRYKFRWSIEETFLRNGRSGYKPLKGDLTARIQLPRMFGSKKMPVLTFHEELRDKVAMKLMGGRDVQNQTEVEFQSQEELSVFIVGCIWYATKAYFENDCSFGGDDEKSRRIACQSDALSWLNDWKEEVLNGRN